MDRPIGVIDSGIGGLTIVREIIAIAPHESIIYAGDSANSPYGKKNSEEIYFLAKRLINFLLTKKVKLIVIACNTITVSCISRLRNDFRDLPIIGTVPVVKKAVEMTKVKKIGVLSTTATAASGYQKDLIDKFCKGINYVNAGSDELVPLIENGLSDKEAILQVIEKNLEIFKTSKIDVLVLGCTHFPFLRTEIERELGNEVSVLDSGEAIARQLVRVLTNNKQMSVKKRAKHLFYLSGENKKPLKMIKNYFGGVLPGRFEYINL